MSRAPGANSQVALSRRRILQPRYHCARTAVRTALAVLAITGCMAASAAYSATNTVIGLLLPPDEPEAAEVREGVALAVAHANRLASNQATLVVRGRVGQWGADGVEAARMVLDDGAVGVVAPPSGAATHLALQIAGRTAVPVISLCPDSSVTQTGVPWMLRVVPSTVQEAQALFSVLNTNRPPTARRSLAVVPDGRPGRETTRDLQTAASASGCSLDQVLVLSTPATNLEALAQQVMTQPPDLVLAWLPAQGAGLLARTLRREGFRGTLAGPGRLACPEFIAAAGSGLEGFVVPVIQRSKTPAPAANCFTADWNKRFGHQAGPMASFSYDAAMVLLRVANQAQPGLLHLSFPLASSEPGITGELKFDSQGNRIVCLETMVAHDGCFVPSAK